MRFQGKRLGLDLQLPLELQTILQTCTFLMCLCVVAKTNLTASVTCQWRTEWNSVCVFERVSRRKQFKRLLNDIGLPNEIICYCECEDLAVIQFEENIRPALNWKSSNSAIWANKEALRLLVGHKSRREK